MDVAVLVVGITMGVIAGYFIWGPGTDAAKKKREAAAKDKEDSTSGASEDRNPY